MINKEIEILDNSALSLCMDHKIPIMVFDLIKKGNKADNGSVTDPDKIISAKIVECK